ncbi:hypothetical protein WJT86_10045 [Microvirga sp. W0021]|uniref:Uncharacterized protein n=1 Tax=Hohaiivirga grylli TaxID=3133970 RepID=A0ABV0BM91_9HYPH
MTIERFFFSDLCILPTIASALEGYALIRGGDDWTVEEIYLRNIGGTLKPAHDMRLFSLVEEALERDFSKDIIGQCGSSIE